MTNIKWYDAATNSELYSGQGFTPPHNGDYYYTAMIGDCDLTSPTFTSVCDVTSTCDDCDFVINTNINANSSHWIPIAMANGGMGQMVSASGSFSDYFQFENVTVCVLGNQPLMIDQDMGFDDCTVFSDVAITVDGSSSHRNALRSINTDFFPCDNWWPGLKTGQRGFLGLFYGTTVNGAGIGAEGSINGRLQSTEVVYNDCDTGIDYSCNAHWGLFDNVFYGGNIGILARYGNFVYPALHSGSWDENAEDDSYFHGCNTGININGSNTAAVAGFNINDAAYASVIVSLTTLSFEGRNLKIDGADDHGIVDNSSLSFTLENCEISNTGSVGIAKWGSSTVIMRDDVFNNCNGVLVSTFSARNIDAVHVENCIVNDCSTFLSVRPMINFTESNNVTLLNNVVETVAGTGVLFDLQMCNNIIAHDNNITLADNQTGIGILDGANSDFRTNVFTGISESKGIHLVGHASNNFCDNTFTSTGTGVLFDASPTGQLVVNTFTGNGNAIDISMSPLGPQEHNGNCWDGSGADSDNPQGSVFLVNNSDNTCQRSPNSVSQTWFQNELGNAKFDCSSLPPVDPVDPEIFDCGGYPPPCCTLTIPPDCDWYIENFGEPDPTDPAAVAAWIQTVREWATAYAAATNQPYIVDPASCIPPVIEEEPPSEGEDIRVRASFLQAAGQQAIQSVKLSQAMNFTAAQSVEIEDLESEIAFKYARIACSFYIRRI